MNFLTRAACALSVTLTVLVLGAVMVNAHEAHSPSVVTGLVDPSSLNWD